MVPPLHSLSLAQSPWPHDCQLVQRRADCRMMLPIAMETKARAQHPGVPRQIADVLPLGSKSPDSPPTQHVHTHTANSQLADPVDWQPFKWSVPEGHVSPAGGRAALWPEKPVPVLKDSKGQG